MLYLYTLLAFLLRKVLYVYITPRKLILKSVIFTYAIRTAILKVYYIQAISLFKAIKNNISNKCTLLNIN